MAGPLAAALLVHVALAAVALNLRPRALPEVAEAPGVMLVAVAEAPPGEAPEDEVRPADAPVVAEAGAPVGADLQGAAVVETVAWPIVMPVAVPAAAAPRPVAARAPARVSVPAAASAGGPGAATVEAPRSGPDLGAVNAWQAALSAWVEQNRRYPPLARFRQEEGVVQVRFELDPGGRVLRVDVKRESGSAALDAAAVALLAGAVLPAPPRELAAAQRVVTLPIRYRLQ